MKEYVYKGYILVSEYLIDKFGGESDESDCAASIKGTDKFNTTGRCSRILFEDYLSINALPIQGKDATAIEQLVAKMKSGELEVYLWSYFGRVLNKLCSLLSDPELKQAMV